MKFKFKKTEVQALLSQLKPTDKLCIVKDDGVYLMSFAQKHSDKAPRTIVYAEGHGQGTWIDGDDFGEEFVTVAQVAPFIKQATKALLVNVTRTRITSSVL
jgi:hypothetical protein